MLYDNAIIEKLHRKGLLRVIKYKLLPDELKTF